MVVLLAEVDGIVHYGLLGLWNPCMSVEFS